MIASILDNDPELTMDDFSKGLSVSGSTIYRAIDRMKDEGRISRKTDRKAAG